VLSCVVLCCLALSCGVLSLFGLAHLVYCVALRCAVFCLVFSCLFVSCLVFSCLVLRCLTLSCLVLQKSCWKQWPIVPVCVVRLSVLRCLCLVVSLSCDVSALSCLCLATSPPCHVSVLSWHLSRVTVFLCSDATVCLVIASVCLAMPLYLVMSLAYASALCLRVQVIVHHHIEAQVDTVRPPPSTPALRVLFRFYLVLPCLVSPILSYLVLSPVR
jgi:hypothetical protein